MPQPSAPFRTAPPSPHVDNLRGIALMLLGFFFFAACDAQAKFLTDTLHPVQIVWFRMMGLFLGVVVFLGLRGLHHLRSARLLLQIGRGLTATVSAISFIIGVSYVPLADAVAVTFIAPFLVTIFGALFLREPVGPRRWIAVAVGFCGMLIVIRPGMGVFHPAILFIVVAAFMFAFRQILSRWLSGEDGIGTTIAYTSLTATVVATSMLPFVWVWPADARSWAVAAGLAATAGLGELLVIRALAIAQAVVVAPMQYSMILWGTFYGYIIFADLPDQWTLTGCAIIVASGLYTLHRERVAAKRAAT
ncbi:DMT family transporter [Ponticoccus litoralis]|uniref:DMT family transporter n=1 Tax=Ponticoccus litoralis TaxID=422297 RepID=A0AAW9SPR4_9RHOB